MDLESVLKYIKERLVAKDPDMRLAVCQHYCKEYNKDNDTCNKCGCYMPLKVKAAWTSCPLGRW